MNKKILFLCDLDDTLFKSERKIEQNHQGAIAWESKCGTKKGFVEKKNEILIDSMNLIGSIWPITARRFDAFNRVNLKFGKYSALDFGSKIYIDGKLDENWYLESKNKAYISSQKISKIYKHVEECIKEIKFDFELSIECLDQIDFYIEVNCKANEEDKLELLKSIILFDLDNDFEVWANSRNLVVMPKWSNKLRAANHLIQLARADGCQLVIGVADSLSDCDYLKACDWFMSPKDSQIWDQLGS